MDQPVPFPDTTGFSPFNTYPRLHAQSELPEGFVRLRLVLQQTGAVIEVNRPDMLIGRHTEADIRLPLPDVSRRHCRLVFVEDGWQVIDLHSLNGIELNGEQVLQAPLAHDDQFRIGGFRFLVQLSQPMESFPPLDPANHMQSILKSLDQPRRQAS